MPVLIFILPYSWNACYFAVLLECMLFCRALFVPNLFCDAHFFGNAPYLQSISVHAVIPSQALCTQVFNGWVSGPAITSFSTTNHGAMQPTMPSNLFMLINIKINGLKGYVHRVGL